MSFTNIRPGFWIFIIAITALGACSSGGSGSGEEEFGELSISLTDAAGDFNQYMLDVVSIKLHHVNGAVVETLPNTARLDFTQYVEVTEFLSSATVPIGGYTKAEITLDYRNAVITVEDEKGNSVPALVLDGYGNPLQKTTLEVIINADSEFRIIPGVPASLILDFDLEASNQVVLYDRSAIVTVNPILISNTSIDDDKSRRLRGLLSGVDAARGTFEVNLRPFQIRYHDFGQIKARTDASTVFEIDGFAYAQADGLAVLAQKSGITPLVALGKVRGPGRRFVAQRVYAGSSVPWGDKDSVKGSVIARTGNRLSIIGATIELDAGHFSYNDRIEVVIDETTIVTRDGSPGNDRSIGEISVGQAITVHGHISQDGETMDAAGGLVRMRYTNVSGLVASVSPLEVELRHVNGRQIDRFNFSGTGIDAANDANPDRYQIDSGLLTLGSLGLHEPVKVTGFPTANGSAPYDFTAKTVIDLSEIATRMFMSYGATGSTIAVTSLDESGMRLNKIWTPWRDYLSQAGIVSDIADPADVPFIEPQAEPGLYSISQGHRVDVYLHWNNYQAALNEKLDNGHKVMFVIATGSHDHVNQLISTGHLITRITE